MIFSYKTPYVEDILSVCLHSDSGRYICNKNAKLLKLFCYNEIRHCSNIYSYLQERSRFTCSHTFLLNGSRKIPELLIQPKIKTM